AHNPPDGILVEIRDSPISYANAFARPVANAASVGEGDRDIISQSVAQLAQYVRDMDTGFGVPASRFWFSPNLRQQLSTKEDKERGTLTENNFGSLAALVEAVMAAAERNRRDPQADAVGVAG
ncbi:MAG: type I-E CRISPR-associated protein Cas7/Cse4/CasC, partial [Acetobacteraceae bacterium]